MPTFLGADRGPEPNRRQNPVIWVIILQSTRPMGMSSGKPAHLEILFSSSRIEDPVTIS